MGYRMAHLRNIHPLAVVKSPLVQNGGSLPFPAVPPPCVDAPQLKYMNSAPYVNGTA